jgi:hypothetical protein
MPGVLCAVGVDASVFDTTAVVIAVVTLGQLPVGPSVGVLMTVTGTRGGLGFAGWAGGDRLWSAARRAALRRARARRSHRRTHGDASDP